MNKISFTIIAACTALLAACGGGGGGAITPGGGGGSPSTPTPSPSPSHAPATVLFTPLPAPTGQPTNLTQTITVGTPQAVLTQGQFGLQGMPDEVISFLKFSDSSYRMWLAGNVTGILGDGTMGFSSPDLLQYTPLNSSGGKAAYDLSNGGMGTQTFDADYAGPGTVTVGNGTSLVMIYHGENHLFNGVDYPTVPFECGVGLATSADNGLTWTKQGEIIAGEDPKPTGSPPPAGFGACNPAAIAVGGYIYAAYMEYPDPGTNHFGLAIARAPLNSNGAPGSWLKYNNGAFSSDALHNGAFTNVLPSAVSASGYAAFPELSFNRYLNAFVLLIVGNDGIYLATSPDLVNWSAGTKVIDAPGATNAVVGTQLVACVGTSSPCPKYVWYSTMVSPSENSSEVTDQTGYIYSAYDPGGVGQYEQLYRYPYAIGNAPLPSDHLKRR
ncbi:MAG TPA: hypothetical protein VGZ02_16705 [Candidatus Baltobacteraceae bacterium]|jgi:hypothetical protein|nr:hypothetical protein [Candidatus Baltobacteraceae bacterium]